MKIRHVALSVLVLAAVAVGQESSRRSSERDRERSSSSRSERSSRSNGTARDNSSSSGSTTRPAGFIDGYRLVLDRNIFSKNRVIYREPGSATTAPSTAVASRMEPAMLVTGVALEAAESTALIEDKRTGRASIYRVGDAIGDGKVTGISIDSIEYTAGNGQVSRVELGRVIEAGPLYAVSGSGSSSSYGSGSAYSSGSGSSSTSSSSSSTGGGGDSNDILERLRRKRLEETKR